MSRRWLALAALLATAAPAAAQSAAGAPAALVADARDVGREIAGIRGLAWRGSVDFEVSDRETIRRYALAALDRAMTPAEWAGYAALLAHCGLVGSDVDLKDLYARLYTEQVAGYYDPAEKTFYLADWLPRLLQRAVVAHEVTHALQDQHFDLARWLAAVPAAEDGALARAAVAEGDAMAAMLSLLLAPTGLDLGELPDLEALMGGSPGLAAAHPTFESAPEALQRLLLFPYLDGTRFVLAALAERGWAGVDSLYRDPPASTEQILHPERYWEARDPPRPPDLSPAPGRRPPIAQGSWGEFGTRLLLEAWLGDSLAAAVAEGWDGDRYALYPGRAGPPAYEWVVLWDSPAQARRFADAYAQATTLRFPGSARVATGSDRFRFEHPDRVLELAWSGDRVVVRENFGHLDSPAPRGSAR